MTFATETERAREAKRARELAHIEEEAGCGISAGPDFGPNLGAYLNFVATGGCGLDLERLHSFIQQELSGLHLFDEADVVAIADATLRCAQTRLEKKFLPQKVEKAVSLASK